MVVPSSASYAHELTSHAGSVRGELGACCRECMKACCTSYNGRETACKSAPSAILALAVGWCMAPDLRGSGYVGPQHVSGTWAAAPSRLQASVRGIDVMHEHYYI